MTSKIRSIKLGQRWPWQAGARRDEPGQAGASWDEIGLPVPARPGQSYVCTYLNVSLQSRTFRSVRLMIPIFQAAQDRNSWTPQETSATRGRHRGLCSRFDCGGFESLRTSGVSGDSTGDGEWNPSAGSRVPKDELPGRSSVDAVLALK